MTAQVAPRFESKFCVPRAEAEGVLRVAHVFLAPDKVAWPDLPAGSPVPPEEITSLYLDSPARTFLAWHLARRPVRFKLRLRRYDRGDVDVAWAEVKHKVRGRVVKTRARLPLAVASGLEGGPTDRCLDTSPDQAALEDFVARQRAYAARATVLIRCHRRALRGSGADRAVGVTVDTGLAFGRGVRLSLATAPGSGWQPIDLSSHVPGADALVEMKHGGQPPAWMRCLMTRLSPWQCGFSKYVAAIHAVARVEGGRW